MNPPVGGPTGESDRNRANPGRIVMLTMGVLAVGALCWHRWNQPAIGGLFDFFPFYHGAQALVLEGNAYYQDPTLAEFGRAAAIGNAYPLHGVLILGLPFQWLSPAFAGIAYLALCGLAWVGAIVYARASSTWLLWWPMWDALRIQQASAAVTVAAILALGAARRGNPWVFVASLVVMSVKPQQTVVLILALAWMRREWLVHMAMGAAIAVTATFAVQPGWLAAWIEAVQRRESLLAGEQWLTIFVVPVAVLLFARGWRMASFAVASTGMGPWPIAGSYVASAWPLDLDRLRGLAMAIVGAVAYLAPNLAVLTGMFRHDQVTAYWTRPAALLAGTALVALALPYPRNVGAAAVEQAAGPAKGGERSP